jgi:hypothetical protein
MSRCRPARVRATAALAVTATLTAALTASLVLAGCAASNPTGSNKPLNLPYAVLFGHVATSNNSTAVLVSGQAYTDSADAISRNQPFGGFEPIAVDVNGNYSTTLFSEAPRKVYFDIVAVSTRPSAADTDLAIPVQLDSIGGTPAHDSLELDFQLP